MLTLTNRIDMRPGAVPLVIHLGQYDSDFSLVFELYSSAGNFTVESGTTAMIRGTKTDGNAYDADATIDVSAKTVTVAGSEQMTAAKGRNVYELVLTKSGKVLSTANFILDVERAAMDADTIASESVLKELNAIIAGAETATEAADRAEDAADSVSSASTQIATNTADIADLKADLGDVETTLEFVVSDTKVITSAHTVANRYMTSLGVLKSAGADIYTVSWYPIENGKFYKISGTARVGGDGQALVCFDDEFNSNVDHACDIVIETASTTYAAYDIGYTASKDGFLVMPSISSVGLTVYEVSGKESKRVADIEDDVYSVIDKHENMLEGLTVTADTVYSRSTGETFSNSNGKTYPRFNIKANETYYYKQLYAYFSVVKYDDGTLDYLSEDTSINVSGTFTPTKDGTVGITISSSGSFPQEFLFTNSKSLYERVDTIDTYYTVKAYNLPRTIHIEKDGSGDFTSLVDGIEEACKYMDSTVYVGAGEWNIVDELGQDYINSVSVSKPGIILKNRVHVIFSTDAVVVCNYIGTRDATIQNLSAFNAGPYGFTLENAHIQTKNCRYCVHDERATYADAYKNHYINCVMTHDNSLVSGATKQGMAQCIGGGLGADGHVIIEGCVFENTNPEYGAIYPVILSYHNTSATSGKSIVEVKGNVLKGRGKARFSWYGTTTDITEFLVHDNLVGAATAHSAETASSTVRNTVMYDWNNVVRS